MSERASYGLAMAVVLGLGVGGFAAWEWGPASRQSTHEANAPAEEARSTTASLIQSALPKKSGPLTRFYQARGYAPAWTDDRGVTAAGHAALKLLSTSADEGLAAFKVKAPSDGADEKARALFDLTLTEAMLRFAHDLKLGQVTATSVYGSNGADLQPLSFDPIPALTDLAGSADAGKFLASTEPQAPEYQGLKQALARYHAIQAKGGWPALDAHAQPQKLAQRLAAEGYAVAPNAGVSGLRQALMIYQQRNGLAPTGKLDDATLERMNVPAWGRAFQIAANMERRRWLPDDLGARYIMVNIADATLTYVDGSGEPLTSRVVVGAPDKQTPLLQTKAVAVTFNPAWHVPTSIIRNELEPKMAEDDRYLESKNMTMRENGQVVQDPGPDNALGQIKFEMPDRLDIYLHDTPAKSLFRATDRARSHGCVRVEMIRPLAGRVLFGDAEDPRVEQFIETGSTNRHDLREPLPVYIGYWTVMTGEGGTAGFLPDVYQRDEILIQALRKVPAFDSDRNSYALLNSRAPA